MFRLLRKAAGETAHFHQVGGELNHLRVLALRWQNGGCDRIGMHVKTDDSVMRHGWTPFVAVEWTHSLL